MVHFIFHGYFSSSSPMVHCIPQFTSTSHLHLLWYIVSPSSQLLLIFASHGTLYPSVHIYFSSSPLVVHCIPQFTITSHLHLPWYIESLNSQLLLIFITYETLYPSVHICFSSSPTMVERAFHVLVTFTKLSLISFLYISINCK